MVGVILSHLDKNKLCNFKSVIVTGITNIGSNVISFQLF
jgi:hypothetical protein